MPMPARCRLASSCPRRLLLERLFILLCGCVLGVFLAGRNTYLDSRRLPDLTPAWIQLPEVALRNSTQYQDAWTVSTTSGFTSTASPPRTTSGLSLETVLRITKSHAASRHATTSHRQRTGYGAPLQRLLTFVRSANFTAQRRKLSWIRSRMLSMNQSWVSAFNYVQHQHPELLLSTKKILAYPGLLTETSAFKFADMAFKGGYLGELVQWSDLFAALVILGHDLEIETSRRRLEQRSREIRERRFDLIFSDYIGINAFRDLLLLPFVKCRIRLLDSFGTEPHVAFLSKGANSTKPSYNIYTGFDLASYKQYWTLYPHSPDNSFLGHVGKLGSTGSGGERLDKAVLYGKEARFFDGHQPQLKTISKYLQLHATVPKAKELKKVLGDIPHVNHGLLSSSELNILLGQSKLFVGLGFPYEGPGPVEALAAGCVVLLGKFNPPRSSKNTRFFMGKPTSRSIRTQHPYLSDFVGEPHVYSLDLENHSELEKFLVDLKKRKNDSFQPTVPHEFTAEGFSQRIAFYLQHQDFCVEKKSIAVDKPALSSPQASGHTAQEPVMLDVSHNKCAWLMPGKDVWWRVDLGKTTPVHTITVDTSPDWHVQNKIWNINSLAFSVQLLDAEMKVAASTIFNQTFMIHYEWIVESGPVDARYVKISSISQPSHRYFVLCNVAVFADDPFKPTWPGPGHMQTVQSHYGQSCVDACMERKMVCEPTYFPLINNAEVLKKSLNCARVSSQRLVYGSEEEVFESAALPGSTWRGSLCKVNMQRSLLDCSGSSESLRRLCPCRSYQREQVAIPPLSGN